LENVRKKYQVMSKREDFPMTGRHIDFLRIRAFANERISFTDKENAHFDACRVCRLHLIDVLRSLPPLVVSAPTKTSLTMTSDAGWRCKCGATIKVVSETDRARMGENNCIIAACPNCRDQQVVYAHRIISITTEAA
jgi:hypothetical protein